MAAAAMTPLPIHPRDPTSLSAQRRHRTERRIGLALIAGVLVLGTANLLGVRESSVSASGGGFELTVAYASVARPGLATLWVVRVHRDGGFQAPVTLATTSAYLDLFDQNALTPTPDRATASADLTIWEFAPPRGDELTVRLDARIEPAFHLGRSAETSVLVEGEPVASVRYRTVVMP